MLALRLGALLLFCFPAAAWALMTIDDIRWPDSGAYPAYPEAATALTGRRLHAFVYGGLYRDSNIFRQPSSASPRTEDFTKLGVGLNADLPISRQRVRLDARIEDNRYRVFDNLNNTAGRAGATWDWVVGNNLDGDLGVARERALSGFGQIQAPVRDLVTQDRVFGSAGYRITPDWRVRAGASAFQFKHSDAARNVFDVEQTDAIAGLDYVTPLQNSVGAQIRSSRGNFPNLQVIGATSVNGRYKETEPSVVAHYNLGAHSSINGHLGYTERTHEQLSARDFKGSTGDLVFHWTPSAKVVIDFTAFKATRPYVTTAIGATLTSIDSTTAYVVARGFTLAPNWAITNQVVLQAQLIVENDTYKGDPSITLIGAPQREDRFRAASLSAGWSPLRPVLLSLSVEKGQRTSNITGRDFDYNAISANVRYTFF